MEITEEIVKYVLSGSIEEQKDGTIAKVTSLDGVWIIALDSMRAKHSDYSGVCQVVLIDGERIMMLEPQFRFSSHPGQIRTSLEGTPDVNKDGLRDVAWCIPRFVYTYSSKLSSSNRYNPTTRTQPVYRNESGKYTFEEILKMNPKRYPATHIQIHAGSSSKPVSVGCFTLPPHDFTRLVDTIAKLKVSTFRLAFEHTESIHVQDTKLLRPV